MSEHMNPEPDETAGGGAESIPEPTSPDGAPQSPDGPSDPRDPRDMSHDSNPLSGADAGDMEPEDWSDDEV